ncbi:MAG: 23S rRNA (adenine(2503)-C(2))-methyltransferase RlmN [Christensenella sp.]|nr:23S rRNA (adenine(2503)-C(2))-methyltransferase RlmN [Christensenella sp.]
MNKNLLDLSYSEVQSLVHELNEPNFRAVQLFDWLNKGVKFSEMKNLPKAFIDKLVNEGYIDQPLQIVQVLESKIDGTKKYIYKLNDGNVIEGVLMKYKYGNTICVSTQVGCRMNCAFCASGLDGLVRNLTAGEILAQVVAVNRDNSEDKKERAITNIVLMGSGEPFDNYENVTKFLQLVNAKEGLNVSLRNISLSTCGLCNRIYDLADSNLPVTLTISLHAPDDETRKKIMPVSNKYGISDIMKAVKYYFDKTKRRIVFEYSMIKGVNDTLDHANKLSKLLKGLSCHVNIIALNPVKERGLNGTNKQSIKEFMDVLIKNNISCTLRRTMGQDLEGACGQLRRKFIKDNTTIE